MRRRSLLIGAGAAAGATALGVLAQSAEAPRKLGCLWVGSGPRNGKEPFVAALFSRLQELGWVEGRNLTVVERFAGGDAGRFKALAGELAAAKVDVIHVFFANGAHAAREAAPNTPIVFSIVGDPVEEGLVASLGRPGGNVTGASTRETELYLKRLELARELVPRAKRVAVLFDAPARFKLRDGGFPPRLERAFKDLVSAGERLGLSVTRYYVGSTDELAAVFDRMVRERADVALAHVYWLGPKGRALVPEQAARTRLPVIYPASSYIDEGGLSAYSQSTRELARRAAGYIDRILRGARPADLPVEEPNVFELTINLKTARAIGLAIPQSVLLRVDRVIE